VNKDQEFDELRRDVHYLVDRTAFLDLIAEHSRGHDRHDADLLTMAYHPDGIDEHGNAVNTGPTYAAWINPVHAAVQRYTLTTSPRICAKSMETQRIARATFSFASLTMTV
jgi:hypothetical protein